MQTVPKQTEKVVPLFRRYLAEYLVQLQEFVVEDALQLQKEVVVKEPQVQVVELSRQVTVPKQIEKMIPQFRGDLAEYKVQLQEYVEEVALRAPKEVVVTNQVQLQEFGEEVALRAQEEFAAIVPQVQVVELIMQVPIVDMQTVPKQTEEMVPQSVERQVGAVALAVKEAMFPVPPMQEQAFLVPKVIAAELTTQTPRAQSSSSSSSSSWRGYGVCGRPPEPSRNMPIAPKQIDKIVPQVVERQAGVAASTPRVPG